MTLSLIVPTAVSAFPSTAATSAVSTFLVEEDTEVLVPVQQSTGAEDSKKLQPIVEVFAARTFPLGSEGNNLPENFAAVIVLSRAVPRPTKVGTCALSHAPERSLLVHRVYVEAHFAAPYPT